MRVTAVPRSRPPPGGLACAQVNEVDAQLRLGVIDGVDMRHEVPLLVARYRPYRRWMEESVRGSPAVATASALGAVGALLAHSTVLNAAGPRRLGSSSAAAAVSMAAAGLVGPALLGQRLEMEDPKADLARHTAVVHSCGCATGVVLAAVGWLVRHRGRVR